MNYKKIIDDFRLIQYNHKMLHSFGTGDISQLIYLTEQNLQSDNTNNNAPIYPLLYVIPGQTIRDNATMQYTFSVVVCDIMNTKNYDIETQLLSDTLMMLEDVIAQFKYSVTSSTGDYEENYDIALPVPINPFTESYDDILVGWTAQITLIDDTPLNRCIAPFRVWEVDDCEPAPSSSPIPATPTTTPTMTPTVTPTATGAGASPTPTATPTLTPTPSSTPPVCYNVGAGLTQIPNRIDTISGSTYILNTGDYDGVSAYGLVKLLSDMTRDPIWNSGSISLMPIASPVEMVVDVNGNVLVGGTFTSIQSTARNRMARLHGDTGLIDTSFDFGGGAGFNQAVNVIFPLSDGKYLVGGNFTSVNGVSTNRLVKLNSDGSTDGTFSVGTGFNNTIWGIVQQSDGKFIITGQFTTYNGNTAVARCRLNTDGSYDATFASAAIGYSSIYRGVMLADDTSVFITNASPYIVKFNTDGTLNTTFDTNVGTGIDSSTTNADIKLGSNGLIYIGRGGLTFNGNYSGEFVVIDSDGNRDTSKFTGANFGDITSGNFRFVERNDNVLVITGNFLFYDTDLTNRIVLTDLNGTNLLC